MLGLRGDAEVHREKAEIHKSIAEVHSKKADVHKENAEVHKFLPRFRGDTEVHKSHPLSSLGLSPHWRLEVCALLTTLLFTNPNIWLSISRTVYL